MNKRIRYMGALLAVLAVILFFPAGIYAGEDIQQDEMLMEQMDMLDFTEIDRAIGKSFNRVEGLRISELAMKAVRGEISLSPENIINAASYSLFGEVKSLLYLMRHMIVIAILSAFFKAMSSSFKSAEVSELGFYVNYVIVVSVLVSSFHICITIMQELVSDISGLMQAAQPLMIGLVVSSGNVASGYAFAPIIVSAVYFLTDLINRYIAPVIIFAAVLQLVNYLSEKEMLQKMSDFIRTGVSFCLKSIGTVFIAVISLQRVTSPIMNNMSIRSAKFLVNAVPVVGSALSGAVDAVFYWAGAVRSGVMVAMVIGIIMLCAAPVLKVFAFVIVYKLTAAIIQPICDPRIVKALDSAGVYAGLVLGVCCTVSFLFIFMVMAMLSI